MMIECFEGSFSLVTCFGEESWVPTQYVEDDVQVIRVEEHAYGVRLSAPGYLDCTDWEVFTSETDCDARAEELRQENEEEDTDEDSY